MRNAEGRPEWAPLPSCLELRKWTTHASCRVFGQSRPSRPESHPWLASSGGKSCRAARDNCRRSNRNSWSATSRPRGLPLALLGPSADTMPERRSPLNSAEKGCRWTERRSESLSSRIGKRRKRRREPSNSTLERALRRWGCTYEREDRRLPRMDAERTSSAASLRRCASRSHSVWVLDQRQGELEVSARCLAGDGIRQSRKTRLVTADSICDSPRLHPRDRYGDGYQHIGHDIHDVLRCRRRHNRRLRGQDHLPADSDNSPSTDATHAASAWRCTCSRRSLHGSRPRSLHNRGS